MSFATWNTRGNRNKITETIRKKGKDKQPKLPINLYIWRDKKSRMCQNSCININEKIYRKGKQ